MEYRKLLSRLINETRFFSGDLQQNLEKIVVCSAPILNTFRVSVWLYDDSFNEINCKILFDAESGRINHNVETLVAGDFPEYTASHQAGEAMAVRNVFSDPRTSHIPAEYFERNNIISLLDVPIWAHGHLAGLLSYEHSGEERHWSESEKQLALSLGMMASFCIEADAHLKVETYYKATKQRFRRALENIPDVVVIYDHELKIRYINEATRRLTGRPESDFIGRCDEEVWPPEVYEAYLPLLRESLKTGEIYDVETTIEIPNKGCRVLHIKCVPLLDERGVVSEVMGVTHDLTESRRATKALEDSEERIRNIFDQANDGIYIISANHRYLDANEIGLKLLGYTHDELMQMGVADVLVSHEQGRLAVEAKMMSDIPHLAEWEHLRKDGTTFPGEVSARKLDDNSYIAIVRDLTERRQAEAAALKSEKQLHFIADHAPVLIAHCDADKRYKFVNNAYARLFGLQASDVIGKHPREVMGEDIYAVASPHMDAVLAGEVTTYDLTLPERFGQPTSVAAKYSPELDNEGNVVGFVAAIVDITERKRHELAVSESEQRYRALFENMASGFVLFEVVQDEQGAPVDLIILAANEKFDQATGLKTGEVIGQRLTQVLPGIENDAADWIGNYGRVATTGEATKFEQESELLGFYYAVIAYQAGPGQCAVNFLDITSRKKTEEALAKSEERYALAMKGANDGVWDWDMTTGQVEYSERWKSMLGYAEDEVESSLEAWERLVHPEDLEPTNQAISAYLEGKEPKYEVEFRMRHKDGRWIDILARGYAVLDDASGEYVRFVGTHVDITEQKKAEQKIKMGLIGTISAVTKVVEARDPYTAGHQGRVSLLSQEIAKEMGLDSKKVEGVGIGATLHDIGKIQIPADILNTPRRLTDLEYALIKVHPEIGYKILKDIEFPWPVADIAYQHHEHIDGSGYPQGLKGEEICLEARIVCVADVVEAMSSHRPYRPGLGIDVALAELRKYRGIQYDEAVVDACCKVINEKGFSF